MSESNSSCAQVSTPQQSVAMERALHLLRLGVLEIDDQGRIWRVGHLLKSGAIKAVPRVRAENKSQKGYLRLTLGVPKTRGTATVSAHRVVWVWLNGPIPDSMQVNHKNLKRDDNRPDNLELLDQAGNIQHSYDNGRRKPWSDSAEWRPGYPRLTLIDSDGKHVDCHVHTLVCTAFHGPCPSPGMVCRHGDDVPTNNRASNLQWGTQTENWADSKANGRRAVGEGIHNAKATADLVRKMRTAKESGETLKQIAAWSGISWQQVHAIVTRKVWRHVE